MVEDNFIIEEYKIRSQEIQSLMTEARQLELYCGAAVAAIYSWFATVDLSNTWAWYLPAIIPMLGLIRSWAIYERVRQISSYVKIVESHILTSENQPKGWENWYSTIRKHSLTPSGLLFWGLLLIICLIFPFLYKSGIT